MELIKREGQYSIVKNEKYYEVYKEEQVLKTPGGKVAYTLYLPIAERLLQDWKEQGYESYTSPSSILSYHFTMVEYFSSFSKENLLNMLNSMNWEKNWTFQMCPSPNPNIWMKWVFFFGQKETKVELVRKWLQNQTIMQLAASTCVYNAFMSYNVAYYFAVVVEVVPVSTHEEVIREFYEFYSMFDSMYNYDEFLEIFECFKLYYGIHYKEEGKHLPQI